MILDTNALSAMADGDSDLEKLLNRAANIVLPVIVLGEYKYGVRQSRHRARYERWLSDLMVYCRVLAVDEATADQYAEVRDELKRSGHPIPRNDLWIAALARQYALPLLSRDQHFDFVPKLTRVTW
ncbi:MAG: type II toxin-antitoxin system VapC family toxin [Bryobacteraceae bacterium]|nr:type II toxin-antitoxin system VapC family toxin [Bryobacteraceae bacterium]